MRRIALLPVLLATLLGAPPAHAWTWPVDGPVLRPFQFGDDPYVAGLHRGIDIGAAPGATVRAPRAGLVRFAGTVPGNGRTLTIETPDGYSVTLLHLGAFSVARGATVAEGDMVAAVGASDGIEHELPSVHLGVRMTADSQGYVDPLSLLPVAAPVLPEAGETEPPADPELSAPEAPSEAPEASEPGPPPAEEPVGEPLSPGFVPATSTPDVVEAPMIGTAPESPSVEAAAPASGRAPGQQPRSATTAETAATAHGVPPADASSTAPSREDVRSEAPGPSSSLHRARSHDVNASDVSPPGEPAARADRDRLPWRLPASALCAALLAALLAARRRLVRRRSGPPTVRPPRRVLATPPDPSVDAPDPAVEAVELRNLAEVEPQGRSPRRLRLRADPDRGGPRPHRRRGAPPCRSSRQPLSAAGARRRR
jgi:hypothetical protein